jgi:hypothetical protein
MTEHRLIDDTLVREADGIVARCICGWVSRGHFTSLSASADFWNHRDAANPDDEPDGDDYADRAEWKARL